MGRKKKETKPEVKSFEYGDLAVVCSCGRTQILHKGMKGGVQLVLTTSEDSMIQLVCDECKADLKLRFLEGVKPEEEEKDENIQEEGKQE